MSCPVFHPSPRESLLSAIRESLHDGSFVRLSLGDKRSGEADLKAIFAKRVSIKAGECLSFTFRYMTRDVVKNHPIEAAIQMIDAWLGQEFFHLELTLTTKKILAIVAKDGTIKLKHQVTAPVAVPSSSHDKAKTRYIETKGNIYLRELGVTDTSGGVIPSMQDKYRQINKFVEIIESLVTEAKLSGEVTVADMGSGKGYLTFATYDHLSKMALNPHVSGIEYRAELVDLCNVIAQKSSFSGLHFHSWAIADKDIRSLDMLIALHACDTATDDAIFQGIQAGARVIVCSPCCHKEIRKQMGVVAKGRHPEFSSGSQNDQEWGILKQVQNDKSQDFHLGSILKHGILEERQAELVTDGLRALLMEACGYQTKVFEFISSEHTGKNLMITGVKKEGKVDQKAIFQKIQAIKQFFGISHQHLERLLLDAKIID